MVLIRIAPKTIITERRNVPSVTRQLIDMGHGSCQTWKAVLTNNIENPKFLRLLPSEAHSILLSMNEVRKIKLEVIKSSPAFITLIWDNLVQVCINEKWISGDKAIAELAIFDSPPNFQCNPLG